MPLSGLADPCPIPGRCFIYWGEGAFAAAWSACLVVFPAGNRSRDKLSSTKSLDQSHGETGGELLGEAGCRDASEWAG